MRDRVKFRAMARRCSGTITSILLLFLTLLAHPAAENSATARSATGAKDKNNFFVGMGGTQDRRGLPAISGIYNGGFVNNCAAVFIWLLNKIPDVWRGVGATLLSVTVAHRMYATLT